MIYERYYADVYDAENTFWIFDGADAGSQACGPFDSLEIAKTEANYLNTDNYHPMGLRPHMTQRRIA